MGGLATGRPFSLHGSSARTTKITNVTLKCPAGSVGFRYPRSGVHVPSIVNRLFKNQQAATLIEYSLIVALIAAVAVGAMSAVGSGIQSVMSAAYAAMN